MVNTKKIGTSKLKAHRVTAGSSPIRATNSQWRIWPVNPDWLIGALAVAVLLFLVYAHLAFGGVSGLRYEKQQFPGGNSLTLQHSRDVLQAQMDAFSNTLKSLAGAQFVGAQSPQQVDACVKGEHNAPIAGASEDNYAYWCTINSRQYLTYASPACQVVIAAIKQSISFNTPVDCRSQSPTLRQGAGNNNYYYSGTKQTLTPLVSISDTPSFIEHEDLEFGSQFSFPTTLESCASGKSVGRRQVYCQEQGIDKQKVLQAIHSLPASAETVITVQYTQETYYLK